MLAYRAKEGSSKIGRVVVRRFSMVTELIPSALDDTAIVWSPVMYLFGCLLSRPQGLAGGESGKSAVPDGELERGEDSTPIFGRS